MMSQSHNTYTIDCKLLCEITPSNVWKDNACDVSRQMINVVVSNNVLVATIAYDAKSRRVKKVAAESATTFFYDDWNLIEERVAYTNGTTSTIHYGRGGFFIHGGYNWGSAGCIDIKEGDARLSEFLSGRCDCYILVKVKYAVKQNKLSEKEVTWHYTIPSPYGVPYIR